MPATSDIEVFNFEGNFEQSFYEFFNDNGLELASANDPQRLGDDYIAVMFKMRGLSDDEHMSEKPNGVLEYDHYDFEVEITIHTDRNENARPGEGFTRYHRELISKIRNLLSISRAHEVASLNDKIEYYWLNRLVASQTFYSEGDNSNDSTTLYYEGDFSILTTAWSIG